MSVVKVLGQFSEAVLNTIFVILTDSYFITYFCVNNFE